MKTIGYHKLVLLTLVSLICFSLGAINRVITEDRVPLSRDYEMHHYDEGTVLSNWYGSNTWAVKFVASDFMVTATSITVEKVSVYFPTLPTSGIVSIKGYTYSDDSAIDPQEGEQVPELNVVDYSVTSIGWHEFELTSSFTGEGLWVVVDNATNYGSNYMSSALGSGEHSFYKIITGTEAHFVSFSDIEVTQELLYSIDGLVTFENSSIELVDGSLVQESESIWNFNYNTRNYSNVTINDAVIELTISHPKDDVYPDSTYYFPITLLPEQDNFNDTTNPLQVELPIVESQFKYLAKLTLTGTTDIFGVKTGLVDNITGELGNKFIYNMMSSNFPQTTSILEVQREVAEDDWFILNFGIEETDELFYSSFANGYYSSLEVQGLPLTEVNGTNYIVGYNIDQLADNLANNIYPITETLAITDETLSTDEFGFYTGTIIYSYEERYIFDSFTDDLEVDVIVTQMSNHYSDSGDRFILSEISNVVYDFDRLNITGEGYITYSFDVETLDSLGTTSNGDMHIVTLVSNASTNEIVSFNSTLIDDSIFVSNDNSTTPVQSDLIFYPNPVYSGSKLNIKSNSRGRIRGLQLYNIRGQKIGDFEYESEKITIPSNLSSGIYFIKARMADGTKSQLKKMLIIKE